MSLGNRIRMILAYFAIGITVVVLGYYLFYNRHKAYEVYMNNKPLAYIKNKEDFYNIKNNIENDLTKRFGKLYLKDNIIIEDTVVDPKYLMDNDSLRTVVINNSSTKVPAVLMKSDGEKIAFLANEDEMKKVLDKIKSTYVEKDKNGEFKLKNHITYIKQEVNIGQLSTIDEAATIANKSNNPLVCFYKINNANEMHSSNLSRSLSITSLMYTPSKGVITSPFGMRWGKMHNGLDIGANMGSPIYAAMDGKVSCREWEEGYGNVIKIDHGSNVQTIYAHCSSISVSIGQNVKRGEKIGEVGSTGRSTGPHVHFEIRVNGVPQDPLKYLR